MLLWKCLSLEISWLRQEGALDTYLKLTANKGKDKYTFTLSQAVLFDW